MPPWGAGGYAGYPTMTANGRSDPYGAQVDYDISTLWVGDLPAESSDEDLLHGFIHFGQIVSAKVSHRPARSGARSGFVRFGTRVEADSALVTALAGLVLVGGSVVTCQWAKSNTTGGASGGMLAAVEDYHQPPPPTTPYPGPRKGSGKAAGWGGGGQYQKGGWGKSTSPTEQLATLWVGSLVEGTTPDILSGAFGAYGQIVAATVSQRASPLGSYNGFVRFAQRHEAEQAMALCASGQMTVNGAQVIASWAKENSKVDPNLAASHQAPPSYQSKGGYDEGYMRGVQDALAGKGHHGGFAPSNSYGNAPASGTGIRTLFVGSLPLSVTEAELQQSFADHQISGVLTLNKPSSRGLSAFIRFSSPDEATQALQYAREIPILVNGDQISLDWAKSDSR